MIHDRHKKRGLNCPLVYLREANRPLLNFCVPINNIFFKVEKNIPRCVAINLKPTTDDNSLNLLQSLKKNYNHFEMGIYLTALDDGEINIGDKVEIII